MISDQPSIRRETGGAPLPVRRRLIADAQPTAPATTRGYVGDLSGTAIGVPLWEWHTLTPEVRDVAWRELVDWVAWLYDRYELATEHRLPDCWAEHPGLIEELSALKAWRTQIYDAEEPSGQAARYWHAELRQVVQAATTFYAKGCRAGHRLPARLAAEDDKLRARWLAGDPLAAITPDLLTAVAAPDGPSSDLEEDTTAISDEQMRAAIEAGQTRPVGALVPDYQHYQGSWWTQTDDASGWQQVTDPIFAAGLDAAAQRLQLADEIAEKHRTATGPTATDDRPATDPHGDDQ